MPTIDLSALAALQDANKRATANTAKAQSTKPAKTLVERAKEEKPKYIRIDFEPPVKAATADPTPQKSPSPNPEAQADLVPENDVVAFAQSLQDLKQLIDDDNPIRDATMQMIERTQKAPHLADFFYENEDAFAIAISALRKLISQRTEKRSEYRKKQQVKQEAVDTFAADLMDLKL